jgi:hypothetical protein
MGMNLPAIYRSFISWLTLDYEDWVLLRGIYVRKQNLSEQVGGGECEHTSNILKEGQAPLVCACNLNFEDQSTLIYLY